MSGEPERIEQTAPICVDGEWSDLANLEFLVSFRDPNDSLAADINEQTAYLAAEVARLRAELGSYGPPETEWRVEKGARTASLAAPVTEERIQNWVSVGWTASSSLVRRGPWVTNEKPNADIRQEPSEGLPAGTSDAATTRSADITGNVG